MSLSFFFFFNDTATTEIYTLSLHDALPISGQGVHRPPDRGRRRRERGRRRPREAPETDRWTLASCRHEEGGGAPRLGGDRGQPGSDGQLRHRHRGDRDRPRRLPRHVNSVGLWRIRAETLSPTDEVY